LSANAEFVANLKRSRMARGWSTRALAQASGVPHAVIRNIESGRKVRVTVDELVAFSSALEVEPGGLDERVAAAPAYGLVAT
jgi:transcriptional regulator with XRE-family HTH domain